jgi:hypothetical protein
MFTAERFGSLLRGKPGSAVDEEVSKDGCSYLIYTHYDKGGHLFCLITVSRDSKPEDFVRILNRFSDELLHDENVHMTEEEVVERAKVLRELAKNVPGLG